MNNPTTNQTTNNTTKTVIAAVVGLIVISGGILAYNSSQKASLDKTKSEETAMMKKKDEDAAMKKTEVVTIKKDGEIIKKDEKSAFTTTNTMKKSGIYTAYSAELAKTAAVDGTSVIFFHAPWCPTCKAAEADINANPTKLDSKLTLLKTDYDTSTELKKQYGVTSQSTFVKVDKDGKLIKKSSGFTTLDAINSFANN